MNSADSVEMLRYTGCGLDNIYLKNGYRWTTIGGEDALIVDDIDGLHREITRIIVDSSEPLDAKTFRFLRKEQDMSQRQLAGILGVDEQTISLYERARQPIPKSADILLRTLTKEAHSGNAELKKIIERINTIDRDLRELQNRISLERDSRWEQLRAA